MSLAHLTPTCLFLLTPSYCWTSDTGLGGLRDLSGAPRHRRWLSCQLPVCYMCWVSWCSARREEGELVSRGPCPPGDRTIPCCLSVSVTSCHAHTPGTVWPHAKAHWGESRIKGQVSWELCILFQLPLHYNANTKKLDEEHGGPLMGTHAKLALYSSWKKTAHQL